MKLVPFSGSFISSCNARMEMQVVNGTRFSLEDAIYEYEVDTWPHVQVGNC